MRDAIPPPARTANPDVARSSFRSLSLVRWDDAILLQGSPLLGAVAAMDALTPSALAAVLLLVAGSTCLVAHVFLLNDWLGRNGDLRDPNRTAAQRIENDAGAGIGCLCIAALAASVVLLAPLGSRTSTIAVAIAALSALYSGPALHGKGIPVVSSVLHLVGGVLHFLLGYSLFGPIDGRGLAIGCFFGLAFAAGHLTQEVRDHDIDLRNGITTNAVAFGKRWSFVTGLVLFAAADALLSILAVAGTVPGVLALAAAFYPIHAYWSLRALRAGLGFESIRRLQIRYRARYALTGLAMAAAFLLVRGDVAGRPSSDRAPGLRGEARAPQRPAG